MANRCTGHCCKNFPLPYSHSDLKLAFEAWRKGESEWKDLNGKPHPLPQDIHLIYPMVIPLPVKDQFRYDCKHLDGQGDCTIYENRPRMCVDYPYGKMCQKKGCTA